MRTRRGSTAIEFAGALPVLVYILLAAIEYSWFLHARTDVVHAVREGVRYAAVSALDASPAPDERATTRTTTVLAARGFDTSAATFTTTYSDLTGDADGTFDTLTLDVSIPYTPMMGGFVPTPSSMSVSMSMMLQDAT